MKSITNKIIKPELDALHYISAMTPLECFKNLETINQHLEKFIDLRKTYVKKYGNKKTSFYQKLVNDCLYWQKCLNLAETKISNALEQKDISFLTKIGKWLTWNNFTGNNSK